MQAGLLHRVSTWTTGTLSTLSLSSTNTRQPVSHLIKFLSYHLKTLFQLGFVMLNNVYFPPFLYPTTAVLAFVYVLLFHILF